jgi:hypothetical protein
MTKKEKLAKLLEAYAVSRTFLTTEGDEIAFGSENHVQVYDIVITELLNIRNQQPKADGRRRDRISQCLESLRYLRSKAYRSGLKRGLITED